MASFDDWLTVTDPRLFGESLAERFRLSRKELDQATQALAPAFAIGLQTAMADPGSWQDLSKAFQGLVPGLDGAPSGDRSGEIFTRTFFGSDALVSAIARQASLAAGIAPDTLQRLMPGLAALAMQSMVRASMETVSRSAPAGLATGDLGGATAEMMRRGANAVEALSRPSDSRRHGSAFDNPATASLGGMADIFAQSLKASLAWMQPPPGAVPQTAKSPQAPPSPIDPMAPFAAMFKAFADGIGAGSRDAEPPPAPAAPPVPEEPAPTAPAGDLVEGLLRTGQTLGDGYAREMAALFERYGRTATAS